MRRVMGAGLIYNFLSIYYYLFIGPEQHCYWLIQPDVISVSGGALKNHLLNWLLWNALTKPNKNNPFFHGLYFFTLHAERIKGKNYLVFSWWKIGRKIIDVQSQKTAKKCSGERELHHVKFSVHLILFCEAIFFWHILCEMFQARKLLLSFIFWFCYIFGVCSTSLRSLYLRYDMSTNPKNIFLQILLFFHQNVILIILYIVYRFMQKISTFHGKTARYDVLKIKLVDIAP